MGFRMLAWIAALAAVTAVLGLAAGVGGLAAGVFVAVVAGYLLYRREAEGSSAHERFFADAGEETQLTETRNTATADLEAAARRKQP